MGQFHEEIPEFLIDWISKQQMFWVASAPLSPDGHVNISPKAIEGTFHVVDSRRVWYEDLSGTGAETVAHIRENGRITILFHAFEGPARIVRLYGKGFFHEIGSPEYEALLPVDKRIPGSRAVIGLDVTKVGTTCGYAVPYYQFIGHRSQLVDWAARKETFDHEATSSSSSQSMISPLPSLHPSSTETVPWTNLINPKGMAHWWQSRNLTSLDGLPAFSMNLGRGFPFGVSVRSPLRATHTRKTRNSSTVYIPSPAHADTPEGPFSLLTAMDVKGDRQLDIISFILPYILTLLVGVFLGRLYQSHLSGTLDYRFILSEALSARL